MTTNIRPLGDRVMVKRLEPDEKTPAGLFIPDVAKEKPTRAEVVSVGAGKRANDGTLRALTVKVGDVVLLQKWNGIEVELDGQQLLSVVEGDILGIVEA